MKKRYGKPNKPYNISVLDNERIRVSAYKS